MLADDSVPERLEQGRFALGIIRLAIHHGYGARVFSPVRPQALDHPVQRLEVVIIVRLRERINDDRVDRAFRR